MIRMIACDAYSSLSRFEKVFEVFSVFFLLHRNNPENCINISGRDDTAREKRAQDRQSEAPREIGAESSGRAKSSKMK